jgi:hypothetical protein
MIRKLWTKKNCALRVALLALVIPAAAQAQPWVGSPGGAAIDETAAGLYDVSAGSIAYNSATSSLSNIVAYINVTDTTATGHPSWNTLELAYTDRSPSGAVAAKLVRFNTGGGTVSIVDCPSVDSISSAKVQCTFPAGTVDFTLGYAYAVVVTLSRTSTADAPFPRFHFVRLF